MQAPPEGGTQGGAASPQPASAVSAPPEEGTAPAQGGAASPQPGPGGAFAALLSPAGAPASPATAASPLPLLAAATTAAADAAAEAAALAADEAEEAAGAAAGVVEAEDGTMSWDRGAAPELDEDEAAEEAAAVERARIEAELERKAAENAEADGAAEAAALAGDEAAEAAEAEAAAEAAAEGQAAAAALALRPSRPGGAPPFSQDEINAAKKALEKLYKAQAAELKAAAKRAEAEERKRKQLEEAKRIEAERRAEAERLEAARREAERERYIQMARQGKVKARVLEPPPPPKNPPMWMPLNATTLLVPRGRLHIKINRITGVGLFLSGGGTGGGTGDSGSRTGSRGGGGGGLLGLLSGAGGKTRTTSYDGSEHLGEGQRVRIGSVYMRFELHLGGGNVMEARSATYRNQILGDFIPLGAEVEFRLSQGVVQVPVDDALPLRARTLAPPVLFYSVWQTDLRLGDVQLSDGQVPAGELFQPLGELYADVTLPMAGKGHGESTPFLRYSDGSLKCWAACSYNFMPSVTGILAVSVHEGRGLAQTGVGKMDSYPSISLGVGDNAELGRLDGSVAGRTRVVESVARGTVCKEGGDNPMFNHEELLLWVDHEHCSSGSKFVLTLFADVLGGSVTIGSKALPVREWTLDAISHEEALEVRAGGPLSPITGRALLTRQFYPAGMLTVRVLRGHGLVQGDLVGGSDPYVRLSLAGRMRSYDVKTAILYHSGSEPCWDETFVFDVVDHAEMRLAVWDFDVFTEDDLIGEVMVDLQGVFKLGVRDAAVAIKRPTMFGTLQECGLIVVEVDFVGPPGLAYPMLHSERPTFTDAGRENRRLAGAAEADRARKAKQQAALMSEEARKHAAQAAEMAGDEEGAAGAAPKKEPIDVLEDDDIEAAFRRLDFDSDLFLTRLELRHALTCMGAQITEMEIDEMVDMVDIDGDGQVAFYEFYQLCKSKELANPMWKPKAEAEYRARDWFAEGGVRGLAGEAASTVGGKELRAVSAAGLAKAAAATKARAEEMARKEAKRIACEEAVIGLGLRISELSAMFRRYKRHPNFRAGELFEAGEVTYEELASVMVEAEDVFAAEAPALMKKLFMAFQGGDGRAEFLDMLLGLAAFVGCTRPQRIKFCFELFDRDGSRTLDSSELMRILKGSHLAGTTSYLRNKAISILKTVNCPADGSIDLEKFVVAANRFPSVFFPSYEARDADGGLIKPEIKSKERKALEKEKEEAERRKSTKEALRTTGGSSTIKVYIPGTEEEEGGGAAGGGGGKAK